MGGQARSGEMMDQSGDSFKEEGIENREKIKIKKEKKKHVNHQTDSMTDKNGEKRSHNVLPLH